MRKIAILLNGSIMSDYRVIKTILTLSKGYEITLFYHGYPEDTLNHFGGSQNIYCVALKRRSGLWQKILRHSLFCFEFLYMYDEVIKTRVQYDIIWANDLPTLFPASKLARKLGAKLVYDSHEIYCETINQFFQKGDSPIKNSIFTILIFFMRIHGKFYERSILKMHVNLFITVNRSLNRYFSNQYVFHCNTIELYNFPSKKIYQVTMLSSRESIPKLKESDYVVLYQGDINPCRGLTFLIEAFKLLDNDYKLLIVGEGALKPLLEEITQRHSLSEKVIFMHPSTENFYVKICNLGVSLVENCNLSKSLSSPNKVFQYIHGGLPVLVSKNIENEIVLMKYSVGEMTEVNPTDIAVAIKSLRKSGKKTYESQIIEAQKEFLWERQEEVLLSSINSL